MICNAKQLAAFGSLSVHGSHFRFKTVHIFSERHFQTDINPFPANVRVMDMCEKTPREE